MARELKIWNGRGWGRFRYDKDGNKLPTPIEVFCSHIYVCAHSKAEAVRIVNAIGAGHITVNEVNVYWSKDCWGTPMEGIEPELGVWGTQGYDDKPVRLYPKAEK